MRSAPLFAISMAFAFLVATQASATPALNIVYLDGSTHPAPFDCTPDPMDIPETGGVPTCLNAEPGDSVHFAISVQLDSGSVGGFAFVLRWDADGQDEMDLLAHRERYGGGNGQLNFSTPNPTPPPDNIDANYNLINDSETQDSSEGVPGHIYSYGATPSVILGPFIPVNTSFRMGTATFTLKPDETHAGPTSIELGFFRNTCCLFFDDWVNSQYVSVPLDFNNVSINPVPEPGRMVLIGASVATLALLSRRARRDA